MKMISLPRGMKADGHQNLYRGLREDGSRMDVYSFWAVDRDYAEQYGTVVEGQLRPEADILDITEMIDDEGYIHGQKLDAAVVGLAAALGIDAETEIECDRLWDTAGNDLTKAAKLLDDAGFDGFRWVEDCRREAYLLIH